MMKADMWIVGNGMMWTIAYPIVFVAGLTPQQMFPNLLPVVFVTITLLSFFLCWKIHKQHLRNGEVKAK